MSTSRKGHGDGGAEGESDESEESAAAIHGSALERMNARVGLALFKVEAVHERR